MRCFSIIIKSSHHYVSWPQLTKEDLLHYTLQNMQMCTLMLHDVIVMCFFYVRMGKLCTMS